MASACPVDENSPKGSSISLVLVHGFMRNLQKGFRCLLNSPSEKGLLGDNLTRFVALDGRLGENSDQKLHKKRNV